MNRILQMQAIRKLNRYVNTGIIKKSDNCLFCGSDKNIQAHHHQGFRAIINPNPFQ